MGAIASIFVQENLNTPEVIYEFIYSHIKASGDLAAYICEIRNGRFSIEEMMIVREDTGIIHELQQEISAMPKIKSWISSTRKELKNAMNETLDLRRVCLYFVYWMSRELGCSSNVVASNFNNFLGHKNM